MTIEKQTQQIALSKNDETRISQWKEKKKASEPGFTHTMNKIEGTTFHYGHEFPNEEQLSYEQKCEIINATTSAAMGASSATYAQRSLVQIFNATYAIKNETSHIDANALMETMLSLNPQDEIEGMLCSRLLVLQDHAMEYMKRAKNNGDTEIIDANINRATKLMRLYNETLQALHKHRRKGDDQRVVVQHQHITVNDGGQAVGVANTGGQG
jgi:hypothetical protein